MGGISGLIVPAQEAISRTLDSFKSISASVRSGILQDVHNFAGSLSEVSRSLRSLGGGFQDLTAFANQLDAISTSFLRWRDTLVTLGDLSGAVASSAINKILDSFRLISESVKSGVLRDVREFAGSLTEVSDSMQGLVGGGAQSLSTFADALTKISAVHLGDAFQPLLDLTTHQPEIDKLAQSFERISKAIQPPKKTIWDVLGNLNGGNAANPQGAGETSAEKKPIAGPSPIEKLLTNIRDQLADWDAPIRTLVANSENETGGTNVNLVSSTGAPTDTWAVHGPITSLK
jgi:hypothetical protein